MLKAIDSYRPHLVMVGMGMPRQELWIYDNRDDIRANIIVPCGAALKMWLAQYLHRRDGLAVLASNGHFV